jgi:hypothetical protein
LAAQPFELASLHGAFLVDACVALRQHVPGQLAIAGRLTVFLSRGTTPKTKIRNEVNDWIRKGTAFDAAIDFDKVLRSANDTNLIEPAYNCGDGIHPSPIGYFQMGKSIGLGLFSAKYRIGRD